MTALQPLYVREGSRFVLYDAGRQHTPPIPVPVQVPDEGAPDPGQPNRTVLHPPRCPHGSFEPWASRNCRPCRAPARRTR